MDKCYGHKNITEFAKCFATGELGNFTVMGIVNDKAIVDDDIYFSSLEEVAAKLGIPNTWTPVELELKEGKGFIDGVEVSLPGIDDDRSELICALLGYTVDEFVDRMDDLSPEEVDKLNANQD